MNHFISPDILDDNVNKDFPEERRMPTHHGMNISRGSSAFEDANEILDSESDGLDQSDADIGQKSSKSDIT